MSKNLLKVRFLLKNGLKCNFLLETGWGALGAFFVKIHQKHNYKAILSHFSVKTSFSDDFCSFFRNFQQKLDKIGRKTLFSGDFHSFLRFFLKNLKSLARLRRVSHSHFGGVEMGDFQTFWSKNWSFNSNFRAK